MMHRYRLHVRDKRGIEDTLLVSASGASHAEEILRTMQPDCEIIDISRYVEDESGRKTIDKGLHARRPTHRPKAA